MARYAIGLLEASGYLDKVEPVNFTTFASPHVGVRTPIKGLHSHMWNVLGARTISMSGRQLFMIDDFRDTGKPLLSILADPNSIFMRGLAKFRHRSAYANIVNDRSTVFYTTAISKIDPFPDPEKTNFNYVKGYSSVIIDPDMHVLPQSQVKKLDDHEKGSLWELSSIRARLHKVYDKVSFFLILALFVPVTSVLFLLNSVVQNFLSQQRIKLYEQGKTDILPGRYRFPLFIQDMRGAVEDVFENLNASQPNEYLSKQDEEYNKQVIRQRRMSRQKSTQTDSKLKYKEEEEEADQQHRPLQRQTEVDAGQTEHEFPILALTPAQFEIIDSLNAVGFRKYPVYIHNARHSHAAIIVRMPRESFYEGKIVVKHWLDNEFYI